MRDSGQQQAGRQTDERQRPGGVATQRPKLIPAFVIWFVVFVLVRAIGDHLFAAGPIHDGWLRAIAAAQTLSEILLICGMTAVGLNISLSQMYSTGARAIVTALLVAVATATCSLGLTYLLFHFPA